MNELRTFLINGLALIVQFVLLSFAMYNLLYHNHDTDMFLFFKYIFVGAALGCTTLSIIATCRR